MNIVELSPDEVERLEVVLRNAALRGRDVRVAIDGGLKAKVGEGMWSPPMGSTSPEPDRNDRIAAVVELLTKTAAEAKPITGHVLLAAMGEAARELQELIKEDTK